MGPSAMRALRVLLVDDNPDAVESLAVVLELWGYDVGVAYDGATAFASALDWPPDCLISDIGMPGVNGYALARRVRAEPALAGVRLVAQSGYSDAATEQAAREAGFEHRFVKPVDLSALQEVLTMMDKIKALAEKTKGLAEQNVELAGQTRDLIKEVKEDVKEVKQEVKELKKDVQELKENQDGGAPASS